MWTAMNCFLLVVQYLSLFLSIRNLQEKKLFPEQNWPCHCWRFPPFPIKSTLVKKYNSYNKCMGYFAASTERYYQCIYVKNYREVSNLIKVSW